MAHLLEVRELYHMVRCSSPCGFSATCGPHDKESLCILLGYGHFIKILET
jgi:hypothetical protein